MWSLGPEPSPKLWLKTTRHSLTDGPSYSARCVPGNKEKYVRAQNYGKSGGLEQLPEPQQCGAPMERYIARENIRRFKKLLATSADERQIVTLQQLLAAEEAQLAELDRHTTV